jgi:phosphatidylserine decarboxylase
VKQLAYFYDKAMSLFPLAASRSLIRRQCQGQCNASLHIYRSYSTPRDPRIAEEEAATVRGNRAARARLEAHEAQVEAAKHEYQEGRKFEGDTLTGELCSVERDLHIQQSDQTTPSTSSPFSTVVVARLGTAWRTTPIKWYPIPIFLGALVLVGVQARRNYNKDRNESRGKVVDENGKIVTMQGPWTVSAIE